MSSIPFVFCESQRLGKMKTLDWLNKYTQWFRHLKKAQREVWHHQEDRIYTTAAAVVYNIFASIVIDQNVKIFQERHV